MTALDGSSSMGRQLPRACGAATAASRSKTQTRGRPPLRPARYKPRGAPTILAARTNRTIPSTESSLLPVAHLPPGFAERHSLPSSSRASRSVLLSHDRNKQVRHTRPSYFSKASQLLARHAVKQQNALPKHLSLVNRLYCPRIGKPFRPNHYFRVTPFQFFHRATQHNSPTVDEHQIRQHILNLFHLVRGHNDCAATIEVIVQQRIVELLSKQDIQAKRRLI